MSRRLYSDSVPRVIFDVAREIRMLTGPHQPPSSEIAFSPLNLPDVRELAQYLIDMGIRPALSRRLSSVYMDSAARYRQVFESHFRRAIQGSCHLHPEHYRDIFVVHFRSTIQVLASRMVSTAWAWSRRAGLLPAFLFPQGIDVRIHASTTFAQSIISGLGTRGCRNESSYSFETWLQNNIAHYGYSWFQVYHCFLIASDIQLPLLNQTSNIIELPEEECAEGNFSTKMVRGPTRLVDIYLISRNQPASVPSPLKSTTPICDLFHSEKPSTCFPAYYPPPPGKYISSPQKTLVTQFKLTPSTKNKKLVANCSVDVSSLTALLSKMSITTSEAGLKTQENRKYTWAPRSKEPEPSLLLSPVAASMSGLPQKSQSPNTEIVSSAKSATKPRRRKIAALPKRHVKTTALPTTDPSLPPAANPPISRTPSLTLDTSSCSDSSDELDTPPSTPPSHSHALIACNASPTSVISSKPNTRRSFGLPMFTSAGFPDPRKKGIHIDFTNGGAVGEQQFSFTFGA